MTKKKTVALVEPSFYGVSFVKAAFERGHTIVAIVSSEENPRKYGYEGIYHDLIIADVRDDRSILEAIRQSPYSDKLDALIPATDYASHNAAKAAEQLGLKGIPYEAALKARNKDLARIAYEEHGVPGAKFRKVANFEEAAAAALDIGYPVVLKPTNCASSQHVSFIRTPDELQQAVADIIDFKQTYMGFNVREEYLIEEFLEGQEFSVELFVLDGSAVFAAVTEKQTSPLPSFVEISHTVPTSVYAEEEAEIVDTAVRALKAIGIYNGPSHVEVKLTADGPKIIEVNGRPGGDQISSDLLIQAFAFDIFAATVDYYVDAPFSSAPGRSRAASIAFLTAEKDGVVSAVEGLEAFEANKHLVRSSITVQPGDAVTVAKSSDDRLGYVITVGDTPDEAKREALELIKRVKIVYREETAVLR